MKKLIAVALASVLAVALDVGQSFAFGCLPCVRSGCTLNMRCRPYNAFTPICMGNLYCDGCCPPGNINVSRFGGPYGPPYCAAGYYPQAMGQLPPNAYMPPAGAPGAPVYQGPMPNAADGNPTPQGAARLPAANTMPYGMPYGYGYQPNNYQGYAPNYPAMGGQPMYGNPAFNYGGMNGGR